MKTCWKCKLLKEGSEFYKKSSSKDGLQDACKGCQKVLDVLRGPSYFSVYREKNKARIQAHGKVYREENKDALIDSQRRYSYGISSEDFDRILTGQGGACAICRRPNKKWRIDHDHVSGAVRAILCHGCNVALGLLGDSSQLATAAAGYLAQHGK